MVELKLGWMRSAGSSRLMATMTEAPPAPDLGLGTSHLRTPGSTHGVDADHVRIHHEHFLQSSIRIYCTEDESERIPETPDQLPSRLGRMCSRAMTTKHYAHIMLILYSLYDCIMLASLLTIYTITMSYHLYLESYQACTEYGR
ncbi:hypothetical protein ASPVEDRAFT_507242 [Aspergillus versicolor CBS 583.65]|uniref:Uncharacterized protein n=1 Tax=Aspergillus versicolor CBS 583.65 TaxID=1036611 RepID=A0A1L9PCI1_ASPVE|nr:uncharacterized protein ASPVEDRAFT_507242 [Aspergillus versicolor CBS 583.65]OJI99228.1 hypothetical protein ASPVEDRAFT_507242 [Aspergillus versicolor CBS 583.65]